MKHFPDIPPMWALAVAISSWILATFIPVFSIEIPMVAYLVSAGLGFAIAGWSALWFWRKKTTIEPRDEPTTLIIEGPYRINRNPIYTGMLLVLLGFSFWLGDVSALVPVVLFPILITTRFIKGEEDQLRQIFGPEAENYIAKTRRW